MLEENFLSIIWLCLSIFLTFPLIKLSTLRIPSLLAITKRYAFLLLTLLTFPWPILVLNLWIVLFILIHQVTIFLRMIVDLEHQEPSSRLAGLGQFCHIALVDFIVRYIMVFVRKEGISALNIVRLVIYRGIVLLRLLLRWARFLLLLH